MKTPSLLSVFHLVSVCTVVMHAVSSHLRLPRIVSGPDKLVIDKSKGDVTLNWKFKLRPTETWSNTIVEVVFGVWKHPGFLEKKLVAINNSGAEVVRTNYEKKISCHFNISLLQVAFTLHDLNKGDENEYGFQVEFDLSRTPLTDSVMLRLEDPPKINTPHQRNISMRNGEPLMIKCHATGFPTPSIKWKRLGETIGDQALYFNSLKRSDGGVYLCEAYNQAGKDSKEIIVRVNDSPELEFPTTQEASKAPTRSSEDISPVWIICLFPLLY